MQPLTQSQKLYQAKHDTNKYDCRLLWNLMDIHMDMDLVSPKICPKNPGVTA